MARRPGVSDHEIRKWLAENGTNEVHVVKVGDSNSYLRDSSSGAPLPLLPYHWEFLKSVDAAFDAPGKSAVAKQDVFGIWKRTIRIRDRKKPANKTFNNYWTKAWKAGTFLGLGLSFEDTRVTRLRAGIQLIFSPLGDPISKKVKFQGVLDWTADELRNLIQFRIAWDKGKTSAGMMPLDGGQSRPYELSFLLAWSHCIGRHRQHDLRKNLDLVRDLIDHGADLQDADLKDAAKRQWHRAHAVSSRALGEAEHALLPHIAGYMELSTQSIPDSVSENLIASLERSRFNRARDAVFPRRRLFPDDTDSLVPASGQMRHHAELSLSRGCRAVFLSVISDDQRTLSAALCNLGMSIAHFFEWGAYTEHGAIDKALSFAVASHRIDEALDQAAMERIYLAQTFCKIVTLYPTWDVANDKLKKLDAPYLCVSETGQEMMARPPQKNGSQPPDLWPDYAETLVLMAYRSRLLGKHLGLFCNQKHEARAIAKTAIKEAADRGKLICEIVLTIASIFSCQPGILAASRATWLQSYARNVLKEKSEILLALAGDLPAEHDALVSDAIRLHADDKTTSANWRALALRTAKVCEPTQIAR